MRKVFIVLFFITGSVFAQANLVRTDGIYQSEKVDEYWKYLRFINDTLVVSVSSTSEPAEMRNWFNENSENVSKGSYKVEGDSIHFSTTSAKGIVLFDGKIKKGILYLRTESLINGAIHNRKYKFVPYK